MSDSTVAEAASFDRQYPVFAYLREHAPKMIAELEAAHRGAVEFRREVVEPNALAIERKAMADPTYLAEDMLREAARRHYFTMTLPLFFGGQGAPLGALVVAMEEIAAGCLGIANLIAVHGLALTAVAATGDLAKMEEVARVLVEGERAGEPQLLSTAITEPGAGTDVEDDDLLRTARLSCEAKPVKGGYRLNGRKVFISNGSIAQQHVVIVATDRKNPVETMVSLLVERDTPGLSIGRVERKMGQKACPAAELVFDDCFVPEARRIGDGSSAGRTVARVLGASRGPVGAFGAGVARGAYERALEHARSHKLAGERLIDHQWVQFKLADMRRNVMIARAAYIDSMLANELFGLSALLKPSTTSTLMRILPRGLLDSGAVRSMITSRRAAEVTKKTYDAQPDQHIDTSSAFAAAAKISGTDLGLANCHMALDIMGSAGLRHDRGMEKLYRDAKLLQIYEGTNQLNRIELYKRAVAHDAGWEGTP